MFVEVVESDGGEPEYAVTRAGCGAFTGGSNGFSAVELFCRVGAVEWRCPRQCNVDGDLRCTDLLPVAINIRNINENAV
jgi:hypothetical protein